MYNSYQLILFLVLIRKFDQSQTFIPDWAELGHILVEEGPMGRKRGSQEPGMVIYSFYIQTQPIKHISSLN